MNKNKLSNFIMFFLPVLLSASLSAQNKTGVGNINISETAAARIDTLVAVAFQLDPVEFNTVLTAYTPAGNRWDIRMAVLSGNDTVSGGDLSGYAWVQETTEAQRKVLADSLPNTCFSVYDLNDFQDGDAYQQAVSSHWESCGYVNVSINNPKALDSNIIISPNPFTNCLHIQSCGAISTIEILNQAGQIIYKKHIEDVHEKSVSISIQNLSRGLYFIKVFDIRGSVFVKKVLKK